MQLIYGLSMGLRKNLTEADFRQRKVTAPHNSGTFVSLAPPPLPYSRLADISIYCFDFSDETAAIVIPTTLVKEPPAAETLWPKISSDGQDNYFLSNPRNDKRRLFFSRKIKHLDKNSPITNLTSVAATCCDVIIVIKYRLSDDFECLKRFMMEGSKQMVIHHDGTTIKRNYKKFLVLTRFWNE